MRFSFSSLVLGALLSACGNTPAQTSISETSDAQRPGPILSDTRPPLHHARHTASGYTNNYSDLPHESFLKWRWERWTQGLPKPPANGYRFPVDRPDVAWLKQNRSVDTLTWVGHATALVQIDGVNVLTDPMFSQRASPVSFAGPERKVPVPLTIAELPHIDVVLISHNHYDHLDTASVQALNTQPGGPPIFLVPLGVKAWMAGKGITNVAELDWGDETRAAGLDMWFVPAQHWSARSLTDRAETLWGGWVVKTPPGAPRPYSFCFLGDTGYSKDFSDIGEAFGGVDLALIPIGAYAPRWFMHAQHIDPDEAVRAFRDLRAKRAIGIHWGTFELADDPLDEPPRLLSEAVAKAGLAPDVFTVLRHGQTIRLAP